MHDSEGIIVSVAPPHRDTTGVVPESKVSIFLAYILSIRESKRAGGRVCGVDMVMTAEIFGDGNRDVATIPPMECPMTMMGVFGG